MTVKNYVNLLQQALNEMLRYDPIYKKIYEEIQKRSEEMEEQDV